MNVKPPIHIPHAKLIGAFFLMAFLAYGFGRVFFESDAVQTKYLGAALILLNSTMVLFIGMLFRKTLRSFSPTVADIYFGVRIFEALALSSLVLKLFVPIPGSDELGYHVGMVALGMGSLPMCVTLYKHRIAPAWLSIWGLIGYSIFTIGFIIELLGYEWSTMLAIPGGLWEITFAIWLISRRN